MEQSTGDHLVIAKHAESGGRTPTLAEMSSTYARSVVIAADGNKSEAARRLGISRRSLYRLLAREVP